MHRVPPRRHTQRDAAQDREVAVGQPHIAQLDDVRPFRLSRVQPQLAADLLAQLGVEGFRPRFRRPVPPSFVQCGKTTMRIWVMK